MHYCVKKVLLCVKKVPNQKVIASKKYRLRQKSTESNFCFKIWGLLRQKSTDFAMFRFLPLYYVKKVPRIRVIASFIDCYCVEKVPIRRCLKNINAIASKKYRFEVEILRGLLRQKSTTCIASKNDAIISKRPAKHLIRGYYSF